MKKVEIKTAKKDGLSKKQYSERFKTSKECIEYALEKEKEINPTVSKHSLSTYRSTMNIVVKMLEVCNLPTFPWLFEQYMLKIFIDEMTAKRLEVSTKKSYLCALRKYCEAFDNRMASIPYHFGTDMRPRAKWISNENVKKILDSLETPVERLIVHCELFLGMRRVEVIRLRVSDIHLDRGLIDVTGKGPNGGKMRSVPIKRGERLESDTIAVLTDFFKKRDALIEYARSCNPDIVIPDQLLIHYTSKKILPYSEEGTSIDNWERSISKRCGVKFSHHDLRRTFGRTAWDHRVPIEIIQRILGHSTVDMTQRYLGINNGDLIGELDGIEY